jgi:hypothetical protein
MNPQYKEIVEAYLAGDETAVALIEQCITVVADIGFARWSDGEVLANADIDYFEIRAELDEEIDNISSLLNHFNIKSPLQEHCEGTCACPDEQVFEKSSCGCGECSCGGGGDAQIINIPLPIRETNE